MSKHTDDTAPNADTRNTGSNSPNSDQRLSLGVDIGGTHISAALLLDNQLITDTLRRIPVDPRGDAPMLLDTWAGLINAVMGLAPATQNVSGIGIAMPGPFDYLNGISMIRGLDKYESLYGINIREALRERLAAPGSTTPVSGTQSLAAPTIPISFGNDAACFGLGEA
ncbi:MAG TPA: hypothetical protein VNW04_21085, partial [Puia sp.]|nr:hypothetical protein [Puia sp.]